MRFTVKILLILITLLSSALWAQNLHKERIWKISSRKRSIYFDKGIFHSTTNAATQSLKSVRNSFVKSRGYERIVFDFSGETPPKIYGHISKDQGKLAIDFFNTKLDQKVPNLKNIKYLKNMDFFNLDKDKLSVEISFDKNVTFDIFYLTNPGRVVVDVKK